MKSISLYQPYATLTVTGQKKIETRGWSTKIRGRIAMHATKVNLFDSLNFVIELSSEEIAYFKATHIKFDELPTSAIVGTIEIIGCVPIESLYGGQYDTAQERAFGDWSEGRYGWILDNPIQFDKPVPARGHQGFWNWDPNE